MGGRAPQSPQRKKLHLLADELGLERDERLALAEYLLRRDIASWSQLDEAQVCRMLDALEGAQLVFQLYVQRAQSTTA